MDIAALSYGPEIAGLRTSTGGRVIAVLSNGVHLQSCEEYVVAIVGEDAVDGPLSLRVSCLSVLLAPLRSRTNSTFAVDNKSIRIAGIVDIHLDQASQWAPDLPVSRGNATGRDSATRKLMEVMAHHAHNQATPRANGSDLAHAIATCPISDAPTSHNYRAHFFRLLRDARESISHASEKTSPASLAVERLLFDMLAFEAATRSGRKAEAGSVLVRMLGLGPGLTPSGDDVVSGILAAVVWQAKSGAVDISWAEQLVAQVRSASSATNNISARLVWYAGEGVLYEPAMQLGRALLAGDSDKVVEPARQLLTIGNTSGSDLAIGMLVGCLVLPAAA